MGTDAAQEEGVSSLDEPNDLMFEMAVVADNDILTAVAVTGTSVRNVGRQRFKRLKCAPPAFSCRACALLRSARTVTTKQRCSHSRSQPRLPLVDMRPLYPFAAIVGLVVVVGANPLLRAQLPLVVDHPSLKAYPSPGVQLDTHVDTCPQVAPLDPSMRNALLSSAINHLYASEAFKNRTIAALSGAVKIPYAVNPP